MSNNLNDMLENKFKERLNNFEMDYDPKAWENLSKRLDAKMPVKNNPYTKWFLGGAAIAIIGVSVYFLNPSSKLSANAKLTKPNSTRNSINPAEPTSNELKWNVQSKASIQNNTSELTLNNEVLTTEKEVNENQQPSYVQNSIPEGTQLVEKAAIGIYFSDHLDDGIPKGFILPAGHPKNSENRSTLPELSDICIGDVLNINANKGETILVEDPNGTIYSISNEANVFDAFIAQTEGLHLAWIQGVSKESDYKSFNVKPLPKVDIEILDKNIFENGLPTTKLSTSCISNNYLWEFEGLNTTIQSKDANVNYYKKGTYHAKLTVKNDLGCSNTASQIITVDNDYNLLAVNGFDPMSNDNRKNTFMPFALTQRSVAFRMIVVDPKDGGIIFESTDASNPWRGIDNRTGQIVEPNKAYIWQVILETPEVGEKSEYKGTIVRM
jgi:hypothetical protein